MANIKGRSAIVLADVVRVRGEAADSGSIAVGVVQSVVGEELHLGAPANIRIDNELVLLEVGVGDVAIEVLGRFHTIWIAGRSGDRGVGIDGEKLIESARTEIGQ